MASNTPSIVLTKKPRATFNIYQIFFLSLSKGACFLYFSMISRWYSLNELRTIGLDGIKLYTIPILSFVSDSNISIMFKVLDNKSLSLLSTAKDSASSFLYLNPYLVQSFENCGSSLTSFISIFLQVSDIFSLKSLLYGTGTIK